MKEARSGDHHLDIDGILAYLLFLSTCKGNNPGREGRGEEEKSEKRIKKWSSNHHTSTKTAASKLCLPWSLSILFDIVEGQTD
jgi:hypothetical protein